MALSNGIRIGFKGMESVLIIMPTRHGDHRGFFGETYSLKRYAELGVDVKFVQDNHSLSALPGTLRGCIFRRHRMHRLNWYGVGAVLFLMLRLIFEKAVQPMAIGLDMN